MCPSRGVVEGVGVEDAPVAGHETALPQSIGVRHHLCFLADGIETRLQEPAQRFTL